jgi:hypothetical protein
MTDIVERPKWWGLMLALLGLGWETVDDDGMFLHQRNRHSGEMRDVVPATRIRLLRPWHKPKRRAEPKP